MELLRQIRQKDHGFLTRIIFQHYGFRKFYRSLVVLTNEQTVLNDKNAPKKIREKVIRADKLIEHIKKENTASKDFNSSEAEMRGFAKNFLKMHRKRDIDYTQKYLNKTTGSEIICSECGAPMVKRVKEVASKGINAGEEFLGCSRYPSCTNILRLS